MSISRPLRKLIKIASLINNNATQKNRVSNIQEELPMVIINKLFYTLLKIGRIPNRRID